MSPAVHVLRKDVRRMWLPMALWLLLLLLAFLHAATADLATPRGRWLGAAQAFVTLVNLLTPALLWLLLAAIVPLLVHDEPTVGSTAFWFTRPLSGRTVLVAKAVFIAGFLIVTAGSVELAILGLNDIPAVGVALAGADIVLRWATAAMYVATLAVLTQSYARFALSGAVLLIAYWLLAPFLLSLGVWNGRDADPRLGLYVDSTLAASRDLATSALVLAVGGVVIVGQYVTRRTLVWRAVAVAGLLGTLVLGYHWKWDFLVERPAGDIPAVSVALVPGSVGVSEPRSSHGEPAERVVAGRLTFSGPPAGLVAHPEILAGTLRLSGTRVDVVVPLAMERLLSAGMPSRPLAFGDWDLAAAQHALGEARLVNVESTDRQTVPLAEVSEALYARRTGPAGPYSVMVHFGLKRYRATGSLSLRQGARLELPTGHVEVMSVTRLTDGVEVALRETDIRVTWLKERYSQSEMESFFPWTRGMFEDPSQRVIYVLRNTERQEALWPGPASGVEWDLDRSYLASHLQRTPFRLRYAGARTSGAPRIDADWLAIADILRLEARDFGRFATRLHVETLELPPP